MKTEIRVPVCLLVAFQAVMLQAAAQQTEALAFNCRNYINSSVNNYTSQPPVQSVEIPAASNSGSGGPLFGDFSLSSPTGKSSIRSLHELFPEGLKVQYSGGSLVHTENFDTLGGASIQLRYFDGYPEFETDPMKNTPQDVETRRRCARRVLLFGGNTFFYSRCEGTGLFLDQKKRTCFLFGAERHGLQAKLAFGF